MQLLLHLLFLNAIKWHGWGRDYLYLDWLFSQLHFLLSHLIPFKLIEYLSTDNFRVAGYSFQQLISNYAFCTNHSQKLLTKSRWYNLCVESLVYKVLFLSLECCIVYMKCLPKFYLLITEQDNDLTEIVSRLDQDHERLIQEKGNPVCV